jgi:diguanylate cyclase (GGDEF)-like protein
MVVDHELLPGQPPNEPEVLSHAQFRDWLAAPVRLDDWSNGARFGMAVVDVVRLRKFNREFGEDAGDEVLHLVGVIVASTPPCAQAFRYGGDEFVALLALGDFDHGHGWGEAVRAAIRIAAADALEIPADAAPAATVAVGVGPPGWWPSAASARRLFERLDVAWHNERDQVTISAAD